MLLSQQEKYLRELNLIENLRKSLVDYNDNSVIKSLVLKIGLNPNSKDAPCGEHRRCVQERAVQRSRSASKHVAQPRAPMPCLFQRQQQLTQLGGIFYWAGLNGKEE